jgi:transcriptional regulator with XRE-family HTH domain
MDQDQRKQVGDRIKAARTDRGWSQARLAEEAGVSENTILSIEKGERSTQGTKLRAVLDALGLAVPADGVLDLDGVPEDVRVFLKVAAQRLKVLPADRRAQVLADIYPRLLLGD